MMSRPLIRNVKDMILLSFQTIEMAFEQPGFLFRIKSNAKIAEELENDIQALIPESQRPAWKEYDDWNKQLAARKLFIAARLEQYAYAGVLDKQQSLSSSSSSSSLCAFCDQPSQTWINTKANTPDTTTFMPSPLLLQSEHCVFDATGIPPLDATVHVECAKLFRAHWSQFHSVYIARVRARVNEVCLEDTTLPLALIDHELLPYL
jgi:hypothetical protein